MSSADGDPSARAVAAIIADLRGRLGLRQAWDAIDEEIQREVEAAWATAVRQALAASGGGGTMGKAKPKKRYRVTAEVTISVYTTVDAAGEAEAIALAKDHPMQSLCASCAEGADGEWSTSGTLDGEPTGLRAELEDDDGRA